MGTASSRAHPGAISDERLVDGLIDAVGEVGASLAAYFLRQPPIGRKRRSDRVSPRQAASPSWSLAVGIAGEAAQVSRDICTEALERHLTPASRRALHLAEMPRCPMREDLPCRPRALRRSDIARARWAMRDVGIRVPAPGRDFHGGEGIRAGLRRVARRGSRARAGARRGDRPAQTRVALEDPAEAPLPESMARRLAQPEEERRGPAYRDSAAAIPPQDHGRPVPVRARALGLLARVHRFRARGQIAIPGGGMSLLRRSR